MNWFKRKSKVKTYTMLVWCHNCSSVQRYQIPFGTAAVGYETICTRCGANIKTVRKDKK